jgi:ribosomal protein S18 acetylase RimI-like enzyme
MSSTNGKRRAEAPREGAEDTSTKRTKITHQGLHAEKRVDKCNAVRGTQDAEEKNLKGLSSYSAEIARCRQAHNVALNQVSSQSPYPQVTLALKRSGQMTEEHLKACFNLLARTSSADYKASSRGWAPDEKKEEMQDREMWYIIVQRGFPKPVPVAPATSILGFLSFMITHDDPPLEHMTVGYIYEVHLCEELRGLGLGSFLITQAERIVRELGLHKMMLTVFTRNKGARRLYDRLGYTKDQCSPSDRRTRRGTIEADYAILSKVLDDQDEPNTQSRPNPKN